MRKISVLLTGGTGQLGKMLLKELDMQRLSIGVLTREKEHASSSDVGYVNGDLTDSASLNSALSHDYDVVVHCASNPGESDIVDVTGTQNLLKATGNRNVKNFIYISIVGVDKSAYKYYQNKLGAEKLVINSGIPYTILRITQFHDFVLNRILDAGNENDVIVIPAGLKFQPIDLADVCKRIGELIESGPTNSILQIGGPEIMEIEEIVQQYQTIMKPARRIEMISTLNDFRKLFTTGINLCPDQKWGSITWRDYLSSKQKGLNQ